MNQRSRTVRLAAAVGAVLAAGATTALALTAGTASADEPGRCTENVNVRENADATSKIVALCEAGKQVALGEERDGFVRLDDLNGWAAKDFVKADEPSSSSSSDDRGDSARSTSTETGRTDPADAERAGDSGDDSGSGSGNSSGSGSRGGPSVPGVGGLLG